jgi:dipeptidyl aminopeptidase/acylaminoacyl peptidase
MLEPMKSVLGTASAAAGVVALLGAGSHPAPHAAGSHRSGPAAPLTLADLRTVVHFSGAAVSPDGRSVAAVESRSDYKENHAVQQLVLIDVATRHERILTQNRTVVASPAWSPNGDRLAFVSLDPAKKKPEVFVLPMNGGEAREATDASNGVSLYAWSPDGSHIAYVTEDDPPNKKAIDAHDDGFEITQQPFTARGPVQPAHVWTVGNDIKSAKRLTEGSWGVAPFSTLAWRPDGRAVAFTWDEDGSFDFYGRTRAAFADVPNGTLHFLGGMGTSDPAYDPAGKSVAYLAPNKIAFLQNDLVVADARGGRPRDVGAKLDRSEANPVFTSDGSVIVTAGDGTTGRGYRFARDGAVSTLPLGAAQASFVAFSTAHNGTLAFAGTTESDPSEIFALVAGSREAVALTHANDAFSRHPMGTRRTIAWISPDGIPLDAVVTEPVGFVRGRTYPLVLYIHGGPTGASTTAFDFIGVPELMAARGWIVLEPNYRGSNSLGAHGIATSIGRAASIAGSDIMQSLAIVEGRYRIDESRIGVSGWSAGGWMTSWLITHDTRWRAAFDGAAVDSLRNVGTLGDIDNYANILNNGDMWSDPAAMQRALAESPQTYVTRIKTPTLIVTDAGDQRVPTPTSYEFYHAARAAGAPVELLIYPVDGHFPTDPLHFEDVARRWVDWFAKNFTK